MEDASVSIRLNPFKGSVGPEGSIVPWSPYGRILDSRPSFTLDPLFHAGCYYVQDSSAMMVAHLLREFIDMLDCDCPKVLDLCAAPGGKTTDISVSLRERFGSNFLLLSNEVMKARASVLRDNVIVWGDPQVSVYSVDPAAFASLGAFFDVIVADVPCSGEGMFRKDPRARAEWSPAVVELCAARQKRIIADVWPSLKRGGLLIYSTCTYQSVENDDNVEWIARELGAEILPADDAFAAFGVELTRHGTLLRHGIVPGEGQWVAALRKTSANKPYDQAAFARLRPIWNGYESPCLKGKDLVPDPDAPLSIEFDRSQYPEVELDKPTALKFLHRDILKLQDAMLGYNVVCYQGHPLGFVKNIGSRANNLLPKSRRIIMNV